MIIKIIEAKNSVTFWNGFNGYLQTDGYQAKENIKDVNLLDV